jgi:hypothetical protein
VVLGRKKKKKEEKKKNRKELVVAKKQMVSDAWVNITEFGINQMWRLSLGQHCGVRDKSDVVEVRLGSTLWSSGQIRCGGSAWVKIVEFGQIRCRGGSAWIKIMGVRDKSDAVEAQLGSTLWSSGQIRCRGGSAWINIMEFGINQMR